MGGKRLGHGRFSPRRLEQAERRRRAIAMRKAGASFEQIAVALGYKNRACAWSAVQYELDLTRRESVEEMREIEGRRLDALAVALWPRCIARPPDLEAIKVYVQVARRKARLFGLDATPPPTASATATATFLIQIGSSEPRTMEQLTDDELVTFIREVEPLVEPLQLPERAGQGDDTL